MGRVGTLVASMSGDRVTPRDDSAPHTVVVEVKDGGPKTSVWDPKDGHPSAWTDDRSAKEKRETLKWGLRLSLDQESVKDEGTNTHSTNGLPSANGAPGIKGIGKEVFMLYSVICYRSHSIESIKVIAFNHRIDKRLLC